MSTLMSLWRYYTTDTDAESGCSGVVCWHSTNIIHFYLLSSFRAWTPVDGLLLDCHGVWDISVKIRGSLGLSIISLMGLIHHHYLLLWEGWPAGVWINHGTTWVFLMIMHSHMVQHRYLAFLRRLICSDMLKMSYCTDAALIVVIWILWVMVWRKSGVKLELMVAYFRCGLRSHCCHIVGKVLYVHVCFSGLQLSHRLNIYCSLWSLHGVSWSILLIWWRLIHLACYWRWCGWLGRSFFFVGSRLLLRESLIWAHVILSSLRFVGKFRVFLNKNFSWGFEQSLIFLLLFHVLLAWE